MRRSSHRFRWLESAFPAPADAERFVGGAPAWVGGVRVIYTTQLIAGAVVLLVMYAKSARDNISARILKQMVEEMGHATS